MPLLHSVSQPLIPAVSLVMLPLHHKVTALSPRPLSQDHCEVRQTRGLLRDLGLRVSRTYFNGLRAPKDKIAVLQGSIGCSSGLQELYFLKFEKIAMGIVWAPGLQAFKMTGSRAPATPPLGASNTHSLHGIRNN